MCRKLAISQVANGRSFEYMAQTALGIAQQWQWDEAKATKLAQDLQQYHQVKNISRFTSAFFGFSLI